MPELKEFENKILSAKEKIEALEYYLFNTIREKIRAHIPEIQDTARALAQLDVLAGLAPVSYTHLAPVDRGNFVLCPHFDIIFVFKLRRIHHYQTGTVCNGTAEKIGHGAIGKRNMLPPFKNDDLRLFVQSSGAGCGRSAAGHTAHN